MSFLYIRIWEHGLSFKKATTIVNEIASAVAHTSSILVTRITSVPTNVNEEQIPIKIVIREKIRFPANK